MVKVSIIVPIYNSEKYLKKCLESLVRQSMQDIEIILIDDGSSDGSLKIISKYAYKFSNIVYVSKNNAGIGASRNDGIKKAHGKYIAFVDSDDYISKNFAQEMYDFCEENNLDMAICDYYKIDELKGKKQIERIYDFKISNVQDDKDIIYKINYSPWNKLYKKELLINNKIEFPTKLKYEDTPFVMKSIMNAGKIGKYNKALNYYVFHNNSETTTMDKRVFDIFEILKLVNSYCDKNKYYESIEYLNVSKLLIYTIQQRYQKDKKLRNNFIDRAFSTLDSEFPNWKKSKYFKDRSKIKGMIEKNKTLTKIYCSIYQVLN